MTMIAFRTKKDKEKLYEKAKKMEEYASMIVDCLEEAGYHDVEESYRRMYRDHEEEYPMEYPHRYTYRRSM